MPQFDVAALLVHVRRNGTASSGKLGLIPSPLWFSGWSFLGMEVDCRRFITH